MDDMYREMILDHAKNPRHAGVLDPADIEYEGHNPLCGDRLHLTMRVGEDNLVTDVAWDGEGCAISQAAASMLGEAIIGKTLEEVRAIGKDQILEMIGIPLSMNRVKCALLSLKVLKVGAYGLAEWRHVEDQEDEDE
ncbi:MAG: SUF system NifU family Fe-S cluster assembly protein [Anaerolineae bacterium]|nr:SUF system NifU family Fe-S cluster assembly protein [Anaerolineae bacterium]